MGQSAGLGLFVFRLVVNLDTLDLVTFALATSISEPFTQHTSSDRHCCVSFGVTVSHRLLSKRLERRGMCRLLVLLRQQNCVQPCVAVQFLQTVVFEDYKN